jgi:hypothetical protein
VAGEVEGLRRQLGGVRGELAPWEARIAAARSRVDVAAAERDLLLRQGAEAQQRLRVGPPRARAHAPHMRRRLQQCAARTVFPAKRWNVGCFELCLCLMHMSPHTLGRVCALCVGTLAVPAHAGTCQSRCARYLPPRQCTGINPCSLQDAEEGLASASAAAETTRASIHEMEASLDKHRFVPIPFPTPQCSFQTQLCISCS